MKDDKKYDSDLNKQDKDILNQKNIHKDGGADEQLRDRKKEVDFTGKDLDIPGRDTTNRNEGGALNDEENRLHSQGGPRNENLEEQDGDL